MANSFTALVGAAAAIVSVLSSCAAAAPGAPERYQGTYVTSPNIRDAGDVPPPDELILPASSGVFARFLWSSLEPGEKRFDWSTFDRVAVPAIKAGKKLSIGIVAGTYAPNWLSTRLGLPYTDFKIAQRGCWNARLYRPWDTRYQDAYLDLMRGLKAHLRAIGGYDNLKIVKISFIAQHTLEMRLPRRAAGEYRGCKLDDATAAWIAAGYRPSRVLAGYRRVVGTMAREVFPDKILSQPTQRGDAFPDIGEDGRPAADGAADTSLVDAIVRACLAEAGSRCAIQNQSLQSVGPIGDRVLAARDKGAAIGWQTARNKGRARCQIDTGEPLPRRMKRVPRVPCTAERFTALLMRAVDAGATYLELWPDDVRDFPDAVRSVERRLGG